MAKLLHLLGVLLGSWETRLVSTEGVKLGGCEALAAGLQTRGKGCHEVQREETPGRLSPGRSHGQSMLFPDTPLT